METTMENQPSYVRSMKLNNRAVFYANNGKYDLANQFLANALHFAEYPVDEETCVCQFCCFEACMERCQMRQSSGSFRRSLQQQQQQLQESNETIDCCVDSAAVEGGGQCETDEERRKRNQDSPEIKSVVDGYTSKSFDGGSEVGFVYQKLIRFSRLSIHFRHNPGVSLSIIIIFNMALVYHLSVLRELKGQMGRLNKNNYKKALKLYELACQLHLNRDEEEDPCILFPMIIVNNIAQIHNCANNFKRQEMCLHRLLSIMMYCIDSGDIDLVPTWCMDGFFQSTYSLILQRNVAEAA